MAVISGLDAGDSFIPSKLITLLGNYSVWVVKELLSYLQQVD